MPQYSCSCGHTWRGRSKPSRGQDVICPKCGETVLKMSKPIKPVPKE